MASGAPSPWKNDENTTSFHDLPPENAVEILLRLPVKSLIRSTSVNKTWYSLILTPNFISKQICRSISCRDENAVLIVPSDVKEQYCSLVSAETGCVFDKYEIPFNTRTGSLELVGSVNGILCLSDRHIDDKIEDYQDLYLWNPSVRKFKCVVSSRFKDLFYVRRKSLYALGFGFHEPTHDYRVVRVVYDGNAIGNFVGSLPPRVEVFSLRMNNWREIQNPFVPQVASYIGTTVNNSVYWEDTQTYFKQVSILSFDFNSEVFGQVKLPDDVRYCLGEAAIFQLMTFEGSLSVCVSIDLTESDGMLIQPCCIWLMRHEDGIVSWTMRFKVVLKEHVWPLNITRGGTLLMASLSRPIVGLLSCNIKSKKDPQLGKPLVNKYCAVDTSFIESLLLFEGGDELFE